MNEVGYVVSPEERRRLLEANKAAAQFFRRELLRSRGTWPESYLAARGLRHVLTVESDWKVGYAPDTWSSLTDHLRAQGFDNGTLVRAGLVEWTAQGDAVDRHRDRLMIVARDYRLSPVGFIGIAPDGRAQAATPANTVHRPTNVLIGIEEQRDLLRQGAVPVIVEHPMDAVAVTWLSREMGGQWAGIPTCGEPLSTAQARILRRHTPGDKVIVALSGDLPARRQAAGYVADLAMFFDRVRAIDVPAGAAVETMQDDGARQLHDLLANARPLMTYKISGRRYGGLLQPDPDPPGSVPELG
ncbi:hypothetical protein [Kribbella yunnanensis]|uniref:hypothetical protein n=1 Tax=Kribbella yunnanensis TaxID=190194 RepID=UPI0031D8C42E